MRGLAVLSAAVLILGHQSAPDSGYRICEGIVPENNLWIPDTGQRTGITEDVFDSILDHVEVVLTPIVQAAGGNLKVERNWASGTVNAYARRSGSDYVISMYGGLARHETVTALGFANVACHEIGHHIGGFPRKSSTRWASTEGQSDYYATLKCMRLFMKGLTEEQIQKFGIADVVVDPEAENKCDAVFREPIDREICYQSAMAGKSLGDLFAALRGKPYPKFETPDESKVENSKENHPEPQCRLDTYFHGALCDKDVEDPVDKDDYIPGTCTEVENYIFGVRRGCWFKPMKTVAN